MPNLSRRKILFASSLLVPAAMHVRTGTSLLHQEEQDELKTLPDKLVYRFVRMAHLNLETTRSLLEEEPKLIRAAWEWGPGDFEMGIDGAAHSGSQEIVKFLLENGAPFTIFAAATIGDLDSVKAMIKTQPQAAFSTGAHEIPLIEHALAGGETAKPVVEFLDQLGAKPREKPKDLPTTLEYRNSVIGSYRIKADNQVLDFRIYIDDAQLYVDAGHMGTNRLQYQGQDTFQIEGTPAQIMFEIDGDQAQSALLREGAPIGRAIRTK